jgi:uncharacterized BrkB/YihY/UPF0761 family membrane protein
MFVTFFDIIEQKILDYFHCPQDSNPSRIKLFWKFIVGLVILAFAFSVLIIIITKYDQTRMVIVGVCLMFCGFALSKLRTKNKPQEIMLKWWHNEIPWHGIFRF